MAVDEDGAVVENLELANPLDITANNVTVRNIRISVSGETWGVALRHTKGVRIERIEIAPPADTPRLLVGIKDIYGDAQGTQIIASNISGASTAIQTVEGLIRGNYLHDFGYQDGDHVNGTTSNGSIQPLTIVNNTILNQFGQTDAVSFFQDFGVEANRTVVDNLLAGGGYIIYGGQNPGAPQAYNIKIEGNRLSRAFFPLGGWFGPVTAFDSTAPGNSWSENIWDETGELIPSP